MISTVGILRTPYKESTWNPVNHGYTQLKGFGELPTNTIEIILPYSIHAINKNEHLRYVWNKKKHIWEWVSNILLGGS